MDCVEMFGLCPKAKGAIGRYGPKESFSQICFLKGSPWLSFGDWPGEEGAPRWGAHLGVCGNDPEEQSPLPGHDHREKRMEADVWGFLGGWMQTREGEVRASDGSRVRV